MNRAISLSLLLVSALVNALGAVPADKVHLEVTLVSKDGKRSVLAVCTL